MLVDEMRWPFAACFNVILFLLVIIVISAVSGSNSSSAKMRNNRPPFPVKVCNLIEVSQVNKAMKDLERKMENLIIQNLETNFKLENLIALVNKTSSPQPTPAGDNQIKFPVRNFEWCRFRRPALYVIFTFQQSSIFCSSSCHFV